MGSRFQGYRVSGTHAPSSTWRTHSYTSPSSWQLLPSPSTALHQALLWLLPYLINSAAQHRVAAPPPPSGPPRPGHHLDLHLISPRLQRHWSCIAAGTRGTASFQLGKAPLSSLSAVVASVLQQLAPAVCVALWGLPPLLMGYSLQYCLAPQAACFRHSMRRYRDPG